MKQVKTNIKFFKGLENVENRLYGFVTKVNGSWRGCRSDEKKKKIVFLDYAIEKDIIPNTLYHCSLIPMKSDSGFIAKTAKLIKFPATVSTACKDDNYIVKVRFGNKVVTYDPACNDKKKNDIKAISDLLRKRVDLENSQDVAEEFINSAFLVRRLYEQSKQNAL